jgi:two-component system sensor histidine kinase CreC
MRTTHVALAGIALIIAAGFYLMVSQLLQDSRIEVYQATEETMVDTANVLAALLEGTVSQEKPDVGALDVALSAAGERKLHAQIQSLTKERVGLQVYVTNADGVVIYDSTGQAEGQDFSKWNDVARTLKGQYGARATRLNAADPMSSVIHVAAPIMAGEKIVGVLTVVKSKADQAPLVKEQRRRIMQSGLLIGGGLLLFVGAVFFWLFRPMRQLSEYAESISAGKRRSLPRLGHGKEARTLGNAIEKMREELEGREYAGQYIRTLTHELKSPLSAIQGAAELLQETMPEEQRQRFLANIRSETERAERLIRRLLRLSEVERLKSLESRQEISVKSLMQQLQEDAFALADSRAVSLNVILPATAAVISGTAELLRSALLNLLENAIDFSPSGSTVDFTFESGATFTIKDHGPGIPDYAQSHLFERFYSLKHAQTNRRGTGLGLCFVREVAMLHGAEVRLENRPPEEGTGAVATFQFA